MVQNPSIFWYLKLLVNPINGYSNKPFVQDPAVFNQPAEPECHWWVGSCQLLTWMSRAQAGNTFLFPLLGGKGSRFQLTIPKKVASRLARQTCPLLKTHPRLVKRYLVDRNLWKFDIDPNRELSSIWFFSCGQNNI